jgi:hypothetical protein
MNTISPTLKICCYAFTGTECFIARAKLFITERMANFHMLKQVWQLLAILDWKLSTSFKIWGKYCKFCVEAPLPHIDCLPVLRIGQFYPDMNSLCDMRWWCWLLLMFSQPNALPLCFSHCRKHGHMVLYTDTDSSSSFVIDIIANEMFFLHITTSAQHAQCL